MAHVRNIASRHCARPSCAILPRFARENGLFARICCDIFGRVGMLELASTSPGSCRSRFLCLRALARTDRVSVGAFRLWAGSAERLSLWAACCGCWADHVLVRGASFGAHFRTSVAWESSFFGNVVPALFSNRPWSGAVRRVVARKGRSWEKRSNTSNWSHGAGHVGPLRRGDQQR